MRKTRGAVAVLLMALIVLSVFPAVSADTTDLFNESVPVGIVHSADGSGIEVLASPSSWATVGKLDDYSACIIYSITETNGELWYLIGFFDYTGDEQQGYVSGDVMNQLTMAGFVKAMADSEFASRMQRFSELSGAQSFATAAAAVTRAAVAAGPTNVNAGREIVYVLNKNTKKYHYPWCPSVNDIKKKNRVDLYGGKWEIPEGYKPCKKCNPE